MKSCTRDALSRFSGWVAVVIIAFLVLIFVFLSGCGVKRPVFPAVSDTETPAVLWGKAEEYEKDGNFSAARFLWQQIVLRAPNSYVGDARFLTAVSYLKEKQYREAEEVFDRFLLLHPFHPKVEEAYWLIALSYEERMRPFDRDQTPTKKMIVAMNRLLNKFPRTAYRWDAEMKIREGRNRLAYAGFSIGEFYYRRGAYRAALGRFGEILSEYPGLGFDGQARQYMDEIREKLGSD